MKTATADAHVLVGMSGLFVFDVVLPRLRIDVPSIPRDLIAVMIAVPVGMGFLRPPYMTAPEPGRRTRARIRLPVAA